MADFSKATQAGGFLDYWRGMYSEMLRRKASSHTGCMKRMSLRGQVRALIDMERKGV